MEQVKKLNSSSSSFGRFWIKIPLVVRSILLGFGVSSIGVGFWMLMATFVPIPWSVVAMGGFLILFWMYFSGKWNPTKTKDFRRLCFRQITLKKSVWIWGLLASFSVILTLHWGFVLTFRLHQFQPEVFKTAGFLNDLPTWTSWSIIIMASLVAGICEEVGYRGYMQKPLERKYGPVVGIAITSVVFVIIHLHQAWAGGILPGIFVISFMIGYLAYSTNSLLPGIIAHVSFDIVNFSYWWSDVMGTFEHKPISITGIDTHFILTVSVVLFSFAVFLVAIRKLQQHKMK